MENHRDKTGGFYLPNKPFVLQNCKALFLHRAERAELLSALDECHSLWQQNEQPKTTCNK